MKHGLNVIQFCYGIFITTFLFAQQTTPTLSFPENNSENNPIEPVYFEWSPVDSAVFYEIYVDDKTDFTMPLHEEIVYGLSSEIYGVFLNWNFYWKVRAGWENESGEQEFGEWSEVFSFASVFEQAENFSPLDGSIEEDYFGVNIEWELNLDPTIGEENNYYQIQLSRNISFSEIVVDKDVTGIKNITVDDLEPNTEYFWRVKYSNNFGESDWSDITGFQTKQAGLEQVKLQSPQNNLAELFPLDLLFKWQTISGAESYNFEIALDSLFISIIESSSLTDTEYSTNIMLYNEKLYWRVQAENGSEKSDWSSVWSFITSKAAPQIPPNLISPIDSLNTLFIDSLQFKWATVYSADSYYIEISTDWNFDTIVYGTSLVDTTLYVGELLEDNKKYYWHVKSENDIGEGPWSDRHQFAFGNVTDLENKLIGVNSYQLWNNYPNPFNPSTTIKYKIPEKSHVVLSIYNLIGQKIKTLKNEMVNAGTHISHWDGTNRLGTQVSSGLFIYKLESTGLNSTKRFIQAKQMIKIK